MARALAAGFVKAGLVASRIVASDPLEPALAAFKTAVPGSQVLSDNGAVALRSDVVILATKPQQLAGALATLSKATADKLVISIAAGVRLRARRLHCPRPGWCASCRIRRA